MARFIAQQGGSSARMHSMKSTILLICTHQGILPFALRAAAKAAFNLAIVPNCDVI
ncbi:hypothetical protein [Mariprofundus ferrooxydans]|uniref:hypothetical protein n=1 Tax=Mariprofundus ferrooxydans TaxID=314344 RepID=UPI000377DC70|nr:hypothetical protein [Mariprofundus ferrooxydans]